MAALLWPAPRARRQRSPATRFTSPGRPGRITIDGDLSDEALAGRDAHRQVVRDQARRQHRAEGQERRLSHLRRSSSSMPRSSSTIPNPSAIRAPYADRDNIGTAMQRLRRRHHRRAQQRPHRRPLRRHAAEHRSTTRSPTTRRRGLVARFLLGLGDAHHRARLDAGDADPVLVAALPERRSADLGHPAVSQLSRATATISSSRRACRAAATASSAAPTC